MPDPAEPEAEKGAPAPRRSQPGVLSVDRLRRLADAMPQIVWISRADHTHEYFNARWVGYTGMSLEDALALPGEIPDLVHADDHGEIARAWQRANAGAPPAACEFEYRLRRFDGVYRWHLARLVPTDLGDGGLSWVGTAIDIDERKRAERERRERDEQDRRLHELFLAVVSHDLRNPLSSIISGASLLERRGEGTTTASRIAAAAQRMRRLVEQLLDFESSRLGDGLSISPIDLDLQPICRAVFDEVRAAFPDAGELRLRTSGTTLGRWDPDRIGQVLSNLITNAIQYGSQGRPIDVHIAGDEQSVALSCTNEGAPIAPDLLPVLFDPFRRADTVPAGAHSVGLGLYIVQEIAARHGGSVEVTSDADRTCFTLRLPRVTR
jgi:PAS domain S-box-containing protein